MKILVVDDSKTMRHVLIMQLKEIGYGTIDEAESAERAKILAKANPPSLIISDWNMPGGSGLDLLKFIRSNPNTSEIPFIMLTTDADRNKIVDATRAGLQSYILKPIRKPLLIEKLQELATAYGFEPPLDNKIKPTTVTVDTVATIPEEIDPLKGQIKSEQIPAIIDFYNKLWSGETTIVDFKEFLITEIFVNALKKDPDIVDVFIDALQKVAQNSLNYKLNALV